MPVTPVLVRFVFIFLCLDLSLVPSEAREGFEELDQWIEKTREEFSIPYGTAYSVVHDGKMVHEGYFGYADIGGGLLVDADTCFYIASTTKPIFALAALMELEERGMEADTRLDALFPSLSFEGLDAGLIGVDDLLSHTSGIDPSEIQWATAYTGDYDHASLLGLIGEARSLESSPAGTFSYSNVGYNILSTWIDEGGRRSWQGVMRNRVFEPLGMNRTSAYMSDARREGWMVALPYSSGAPNPREALYLKKRDNTMHAAGGLISTPRDLSQFLIAQLDDGEVAGERVFSETVISDSHRVLSPVEVEGTKKRVFSRDGYAWGWFVGAFRGHKVYHHSGGFPGASSHLSFCPELDIGVAILSNEGRLGNSLNRIIAESVYLSAIGGVDPAEVRESKLEDLKAGYSGFLNYLEGKRLEREGWQWQLSLPKEAYVGIYSHPRLGNLTVSLVGDETLHFSWGNLRSEGIPGNGEDVVLVELIPESNEEVRFVVEGLDVEAVEYRGMSLSRE